MTIDPDENHPASPSDSAPDRVPHDRRARTGRRWPPLWVWITWVLAALVIAAVRSSDVTADHAVANVITLIVAFVGLLAAIVWFVFRSGYSRRFRWGSAVVGCAGIALLAALIRIEGVSAELVPSFNWRFASKADRLLDSVVGRSGAEQGKLPLDLTPTENDFPQFLGPHRDLAIGRLELYDDWRTRPPQLLWKQPIGAGWSAFSTVGPYAFTMEQRGEVELVTCYEIATGRLCWAHATKTRYDTVLAGCGPRATPTIDEGMVYALGATGDLLCLDGASGRVVWKHNLLEQFGVSRENEEEEVPYGRANSPLVVGPLVIVPAGGTEASGWVSLVAYDKRTGQPVWQGGRWQVSYSSPVLANVGGQRQIWIVNQDYATGHDPQTGSVLWEHPWPGRSATNANVSQPVPVPPDCVLLSKGYGHGASLVQLLPNGDGTFTTKQLWHNPRVLRTKFANVVIYEGHVYGLSDGILECVELSEGRRVWKRGRYGHGQILRVGQRLLVLSDSGELVLIELTPKKPNHVLARLQALQGKTWNNFALAGPRLLLRNAREAACYRLPLKR